MLRFKESHLLLPLVSYRVGALIWHFLQLGYLLLFGLADDLRFPQQTLNCGRVKTQALRKQSALASGYKHMDTHGEMCTCVHWRAASKCVSKQIFFFKTASFATKFMFFYEALMEIDKNQYYKWEDPLWKDNKKSYIKKATNYVIKLLTEQHSWRTSVYTSSLSLNCIFLCFLLWVFRDTFINILPVNPAINSHLSFPAFGSSPLILSAWLGTCSLSLRFHDFFGPVSKEWRKEKGIKFFYFVMFISFLCSFFFFWLLKTFWQNTKVMNKQQPPLVFSATWVNKGNLSRFSEYFDNIMDKRW